MYLDQYYELFVSTIRDYKISNLSVEQKLVLKNIINNPQHSWMVEYKNVVLEAWMKSIDREKLTKNDQ